MTNFMTYDEMVQLVDDLIQLYDLVCKSLSERLWLYTSKGINQRPQKRLDRSTFKISSVKRRFFDNIGIIPGHKWNPTALAQNHRRADMYRNDSEEAGMLKLVK